jgi:DNA-binding NtrC family response regulator
LTFDADVQKKISAVTAAETGSKSRLARELGVRRASLYYHHRMPGKDEALRRQIEAVMLEHPSYGSPRVAIALGIDEKRIARVMRKFGLKPARRSPLEDAQKAR